MSSFSLRSTEIGWSESVEPRFKVHLLDEGYVWVLTTCSFTEDFGFCKPPHVKISIIVQLVLLQLTFPFLPPKSNYKNDKYENSYINHRNKVF